MSTVSRSVMDHTLKCSFQLGQATAYFSFSDFLDVCGSSTYIWRNGYIFWSKMINFLRVSSRNVGFFFHTCIPAGEYLGLLGLLGLAHWDFEEGWLAFENTPDTNLDVEIVVLRAKNYIKLTCCAIDEGAVREILVT